MTLKTFKGTLVLNMRSGAMRIVKRKATAMSHQEVAVKFTVEVEAPEQVVPEVQVKVVVPRKQFNAVVLDSI